MVSTWLAQRRNRAEREPSPRLPLDMRRITYPIVGPRIGQQGKDAEPATTNADKPIEQKPTTAAAPRS